MKPQRTLSLDATYVLIALAPIILRVLIMPVAPNDFWWHMATGRIIAATGSVPLVDHFSYTREGAPFYNQSWLAQLFFYGLHQLGGVPVVIIGQTLAVALAYGLLLWLCIRRTQSPRLCVGLLLAGMMPMSFDNWQVRPQTFALPLFVAYLVVLTGYRFRWWRMLWLLPVLMAVWVNLHGSFEQGLALIALTLIGEGIRRWRGDKEALTWPEWRGLALWGALAGAATLLNPRGASVYFYVHDVLRHPSTRFSSEWAHPSFGQFTDVYFFLFLIVLCAVLWRARRCLLLTDWLLVLPFLAVALISSRSIMWFAIVALPLMAVALKPQLAPGAETKNDSPATASSASGEMSERAATVMNSIVVAVVWLAVFAFSPWTKPSLGLPPQLGNVLDSVTPLNATAALRKLPPDVRPQRLFHSEAHGSYLTWAAPEQKVFIDTRFELYPPQQWRDFNELKRGRNVAALLQKYRFDGLLLGKQEHKELLHEVRQSGNWRIVHENPGAVLLVRAPR
jgi:hypothetical protein